MVAPTVGSLWLGHTGRLCRTRIGNIGRKDGTDCVLKKDVVVFGCSYLEKSTAAVEGCFWKGRHFGNDVFGIGGGQFVVFLAERTTETVVFYKS